MSILPATSLNIALVKEEKPGLIIEITSQKWLMLQRG